MIGLVTDSKGRLCFHGRVSVHRGWGRVSLDPSPLGGKVSLVPCPFQGVEYPGVRVYRGVRYTHGVGYPGGIGYTLPLSGDHCCGQCASYWSAF